MIVNYQEDTDLKVLYLKFFNLSFKIYYASTMHAHPKTLQHPLKSILVDL